MIGEKLNLNKAKITSFFKRVRIKALQEHEWRSVDPEGRSFRNVNTPEDWKSIEWN